jgi:hypothetical protein
MGQSRIGSPNRRYQRFDHFALDPVRQVLRVGNVGKSAPAIGDFLVLGKRVGDQREGAQVLRESPAQRCRRSLAGCGVAVLQQAERRFDGERLGADLETQARDGIIEQPIPGALPGHGFLMEKLLDAILELIGLFLADVLDPRPVATERGVRHGVLQDGVVNLVEFQ